jgi:AmmeMemoRadiSam system protein A
MHPLVELAKRSVEEFIRKRKELAEPETLSPEMAEKTGVFVCVKKHGQLRGCIGTIMPVTENTAQETIRNAVSAATQDPRFPPVREQELDELEYSVDVLTPPERVKDVSELDPKKYGIIVTSGPRKGLLLPDLEGVKTVDEQLKIAKMKAGIGEDDQIEMFKFSVRRYK